LGRAGRGLFLIGVLDAFIFISGLTNKSCLCISRSAFLAKAQSLSQGNYGRPNPMEDYLYLRVSQKEPFDILYVTPSLTTILNLHDSSFSIAPEIAYTAITNLELRLKATFLVGGEGTEFGEKPNNYRIEFRARYYF